MSSPPERKSDAQYGLKIEKPCRENPFSESAVVRILLLLLLLAVCALFVQQAIYRNAAKQYETAVSAVSVSVENSASVSMVEEEQRNAPVNINTADLDELCRLKGIAEGRAQAIIDYRVNNGAFTYKEEIMKVDGIGEKLYAGLAPQIVLDDSEITTQTEDPSHVG